MVLSGRDVGEIRVAHRRKAVPSIHRINGLGQLGAAILVDTTGVDPEVIISGLARDLACLQDLRGELGIDPDAGAWGRL